MGFPACRSVPLVRSSYRSGKLWAEAMKNLGREIPAEFTGLVELASAGAARQEASAVLDRMSPENVLTSAESDIPASGSLVGRPLLVSAI